MWKPARFEIKDEVIPVLLTEKHTMKTYWRVKV